MKLSDFPPEDCCNLLQGILCRYHSAKERWPVGRGMITEIYLSIEEARLIYAAGQYLKKYNDWNDEASKAGGKIGIYPADTSLSYCAKYMIEIAAGINKDDPRIILKDRDMKIIDSIVRHLDHYALMMSFKEKPKGNWKRK